MLQNYFKIAFRNLWKYKGLSFINISGLAAGLACSLVIFLFVSDELSYDRFNRDADRIYRVVKDFVNDDGSILPDATTPPAIGPAIQKEIPGIEQVTRVFPNWGNHFLLSYGEKHIYEERIYRVDSSFFDVFSLPFLEGNAATALKDPNSIILTRRMAKKYFGSTSPMGKVIRGDILGNLVVSGVIGDFPAHAHFHADFLIPVRKFSGNIDDNWGWYNFYTYIKTKPGTRVADLNSKIQALYKRHNTDAPNHFYVQPLTGIHLDSHLKWELEPNGERLYAYAFGAGALLILLIAAINYINLVTARSSLRAREIGIRKVCGANDGSLVRQFLLESAVICLLAAFFALAIAQFLLPLVNDITGKQLALSGSSWLLIFGFFLAALGVGIFAGLFPALYLASFKTIQVLKGRKAQERGVFNLRKGLVVVQFSISIGLIAGVLIIFQQVNYIRQKNLGLNKDQVIIIRDFAALYRSEKDAFQQELHRIPGVVRLSPADGVLGGLNWTTGLRAKGSNNSQLVNFLDVGYNYLDVMGISLKEGRDFSEAFPADTLTQGSHDKLEQDIGGIILNEKAVKDLAVPLPLLGQRIRWGNDGDTIHYLHLIGIARDFHFASFKNEIKPFAFIANPRRVDNLTVKLSAAKMGETISAIEKAWKHFAPERPLQYFFLDDSFAALYLAETNFQKIFVVLVILSILIACLGLLGLAMFAASQRTKEIGVRKVLGATLMDIITMLSIDFLKPLVISVLIGSVLAYWAMSKWLENYAYRIEVKPWTFLIAGLISVVIAMVTISYQALRSARANPVKSLRVE